LTGDGIAVTLTGHMRALLPGLAGAALLVLAPLSACSTDDGRSGAPGSSSGSTASGGTSGTSGSSGKPGDPSGPDAAPAVPNVETAALTMEFRGATRNLILAKPTNYDAQKSYPLIVAFHGNPGNETALPPFDSASEKQAVIVYPRALYGTGNEYHWNLSITDGNDDMDWMAALVDEIKKTVNIDKQSVFGFGYSGGGFFLANFACRTGGVFKAISINSGGAPFVDDGVSFPKRPNGCLICPGGPVPSIVTHGMLDNEVGTEGGVENARCAAATNACGSATAATTPAPCERYSGCSAALDVKLCNIPGFGHGLWEGAIRESWAFFKTFLP
jgi:polyhydroxybutyrate depolymerase